LRGKKIGRAESPSALLHSLHHRLRNPRPPIQHKMTHITSLSTINDLRMRALCIGTVKS